MNKPVLESGLQVDDHVVYVSRWRLVARLIDDIAHAVSEYDLAVFVVLTTKATLMHQPVMKATKLYQVIQTLLATRRPLL